MVRQGTQLVIVESPAKAKTLSQFLGTEYTVKASMGHVRDLPGKELGVEVDKDFSPKYVVLPGKKKVLREIKAMAKVARAVYLATDPDREGEAISWHIVEAVGLDKKKLYKRVVFHEITKEAIVEAFRHPREIDLRLVNAQQARRILDRLVGYKLSPLLWRKVRPGLSAGRVQSVTLRLIVDREAEIKDFLPVEYWSIDAELAKNGSGSFKVELVSTLGKKKIDLKNKEQTYKLVAVLDKANYAVSAVRQKRVSRQPAPPFITSTLQQEAWNKFKFSAKRTMAIAQQLYEGLPLGDEGSVGLITYMRTDSTKVSSAALSETRSYIAQRYGEDFLPKSPRYFSRKVKAAQEAHEAIRPTSIMRVPDQVGNYLSAEQLKLYTIIWQRMVASQMAAAGIDNTTVDIAAKAAKEHYLLRATSSVVAFPGFLILYREYEEKDEDGVKSTLPELASGDKLKLLGLFPEQHFTKPSPRYTEATLVKALEQNGIGRPSTYAPILSLVQERGYVERRNGRLEPTELGSIVSKLLVEHFTSIVDIGFTAQMEGDLDRIADGQEWIPMLREFYQPFKEMVNKAKTNISKVIEPTDETCEKCGRPMVIKWSRYGKFMSCSGFPECKNAKSIAKRAPVATGAHCPKCGGEIVERRSKRGRIFYGCARFPDCDFASWSRPLPQPCPQCQGLITLVGKADAKCSQCGYKVGSKELDKFTETLSMVK
ncbi:type I DNA topoisomerase [Chloroflexota bacterium]